MYISSCIYHLGDRLAVNAKASYLLIEVCTDQAVDMNYVIVMR